MLARGLQEASGRLYLRTDSISILRIHEQLKRVPLDMVPLHLATTASEPEAFAVIRCFWAARLACGV